MPRQVGGLQFNPSQLHDLFHVGLGARVWSLDIDPCRKIKNVYYPFSKNRRPPHLGRTAVFYFFSKRRGAVVNNIEATIAVSIIEGIM